MFIDSQKEDTITEKFSSNGASVIPTGNGDAEKPIPAVSTNNGKLRILCCNESNL